MFLEVVGRKVSLRCILGNLLRKKNTSYVNLQGKGCPAQEHREIPLRKNRMPHPTKYNTITFNMTFCHKYRTCYLLFLKARLGLHNQVQEVTVITSLSKTPDC